MSKAVVLKLGSTDVLELPGLQQIVAKDPGSFRDHKFENHGSKAVVPDHV